MLKDFFNKRILLIAGHYGSGKTEFAVSLAMQAAAAGLLPLSILDLDIVNPYFRARERKLELNKVGIEVLGSVFEHEITAELPELSASIRKPLEDENCRVIVDLGGNDAGARVLCQFGKYFRDKEFNFAIVINANRYETQNADDALQHIYYIENELGMQADYLINNTHLLRETTIDDIIKGHKLCADLAEKTGKSILCDCYPQGIIAPSVLDIEMKPFGVGLYMRQSWLDR